MNHTQWRIICSTVILVFKIIIMEKKSKPIKYETVTEINDLQYIQEVIITTR